MSKLKITFADNEIIDGVLASGGELPEDRIYKFRCAFCGGEMIAQTRKERRKNSAADFVYFFRCLACAARSGHSSDKPGAVRLVLMRQNADILLRQKFENLLLSLGIDPEQVADEMPSFFAELGANISRKIKAEKAGRK